MKKRQNKRRVDDIKRIQANKKAWKANHFDEAIEKVNLQEAEKKIKALEVSKRKSLLKRKNKTYKKRKFKETGGLKYLIGLTEKTNRKLITDYCKKIDNEAWGKKLISKLYPESINKNLV